MQDFTSKHVSYVGDPEHAVFPFGCFLAESLGVHSPRGRIPELQASIAGLGVDQRLCMVPVLHDVIDHYGVVE